MTKYVTTSLLTFVQPGTVSTLDLTDDMFIQEHTLF